MYALETGVWVHTLKLSFTKHIIVGDILISLSLSVSFCKILLQRVFARIK